MDQYQEHTDFSYATDGEWDRAAASERGAADLTRAWILTDRDVWYANPFYHGPAVRHPEDHPEDDQEYDAIEPVSAMECPF